MKIEVISPFYYGGKKIEKGHLFDNVPADVGERIIKARAGKLVAEKVEAEDDKPQKRKVTAKN